MTQNDQESNHFQAWFLLIALSLIWGSSFILIKKSLVGLSAPMVGALRVIFASLFLLPFFIKNLRGISRYELKYLFFVGLTGSFIPAVLFALAQTKINSSVAGLLNSLTPTMVLIVGVLFYKQTIQKNSVVGLILGLVGSFILIAGFSLRQFATINFHSLFVVLATLMYGINLNIIKYKLVSVKSTRITIVSICMVMPLALGYLLLFTPFTSLKFNDDVLWAIFAVAALGIIGTGLALFLFNKMVKISSTIFSSSVTYLIPIVALFWGIIDQEAIQLHHIIGLITILAGIILINKRP